ncbi:MAG: S41 family peptidase [bacterium]|nr:S41 family peptidase [bacterium]
MPQQSVPHTSLERHSRSPLLILIPALLWIGITFTACAEKKAPPLDPAELFENVEGVLAADYYFEEGQGWNLAELYGKAQASLGHAGGGKTREALAATLAAAPEDERRRQTYTALGAFLEALPAGYNTFTRAESLLWSRDPERTAGVGLVLRMVGPGRFLAMDTLEGSASYRASMEPGNYLAEIDGQSTKDMDLEEVVGRIRGPAETEVVLKYESGKSFTLQRGEVSFRNILNAEWSLPGGKRAEYIMLRSSLADTVGQIRGLLARLGQRQTLILDLRRMHHGNYENCFGVANLFVDSGRLGGVRFRGREPVDFIADSEKIFKGSLYVVLGENASPFAETLAAALSVAPNVTLIGKAGEGRAFVSSVTPISGGVEVTLTGGLVLGPDDKPLYTAGVPVEATVAAPLPRNPPLTTVDRDDPVQVYLAQKLGMQ